jgi:hypothetical protein
MQRLADVKERDATFREEKHLASLTQPLVSNGVLHYAAPAQVEKHTLAPVEEDLAVDGDHLTMTRAGAAPQSLQLSDQPELHALVTGIRGTLAGDLPALEHDYSVGLEGTPERWRLTLVPLNDRVQHFLKVIRIDGRDGEVDDMQTVDANGDTSDMTITPQSR